LDDVDGSSESSDSGSQAEGTDSGDAVAAVSLPATYPLDAVPLIDGVVVEAADAGMLWNVIVVPDSSMDAVADEAEALLTDRGMVLIAEKGENRVYKSDDFDVNVNLHDDGTVSYTVFPR